MIEKSIGVVVWGVGEHAQRNIIPAIHLSDQVWLVGCYSRDAAKLNDFDRSFVGQVYKTEECFLSDPNVTAVVVCSPNGAHLEQVRKCIRAGKHILVEKTAFPTVSDTTLVLSEAEARGVVVMEAFMYLYHQQFSTFTNLLREERYGRLLSLDCQFGFPHLPKDNIRYSKDLDGGALNDAGAYTISAARTLLGGQVKVVGACLGYSNEHDVDLKGAAILVGEQGATANCSWVFGGAYINMIKAWCEDAHIEVLRAFSKPPEHEAKISVKANGQIVEELAIEPDNHFVNMLSVFSMNVKNGSFYETSMELLDQARTMQAIRLFK